MGPTGRLHLRRDRRTGRDTTAELPRKPKFELAVHPLPEVDLANWEFDLGLGTSRHKKWPAGWEHVAVVWDSAREDVKLYVGGGYPNSMSNSVTWHADDRLVLGKVLGGSRWQKPFVGDIDDVRVYAGALSYTQVEQIMEASAQ